MATVPTGLSGRSGFHTAAFAEWQATGALSVVTRAGCTQRGYREVARDLTATDPNAAFVESDSHIGYLSVPLFLKLRHVSEKATGYALAGTALDLVLHRSVGVLDYADGGEESLFVREVNSWALGGTVGVGLEVSTLLPWVVLVEARYYWEVTDALSASDVQAFSPWTGRPTREIEARGRALEFSIGMMF